MKIINQGQLRVLKPEEGLMLRNKNDVYEAEHIDIETGELIPEHFSYYTDTIYIGVQIQTIEDAQEIYIEEEIESEV